MHRSRMYMAGFAFLFLFSLHATAQDDGINFTAITVKEGLSSNTVNAMIKDRYGLMWFGTTNGLSRFDGTNFVNYRHEAGNSYSLPTNEIMSIFEDHQGRLWVGLNGGGLRYYDRKFDRFLAFKGDGSWANIQGISIRAIHEDHRGMIWIATYGDLRFANPETGRITRLPITDSHQDPFNQLVVLALFEDHQHRMWVGTNRGLFLYNWQTQTFRRFMHNAGVEGSLSNDVVKAIAEDETGHMWFGTYGGLNKMVSEGKFVVYKHERSVANSLSNDAVFAVGTAGNGKLWIGTEDGVNILDPASGMCQLLRADSRNVFSLKSNSVRSFYFDKKGISWVGTFGGGIGKYDKHLALLNLKQSNPYDASGLKSPFVNAFAEYKNGQVFIGTDGGGLAIFDRSTKLMTPVPIHGNFAQSGRNLTITSLFVDSKGILWAGAYHNGLLRIDPASGETKQFINDGTEYSISQNDITAVIEDKTGNLWIGTLGHGVDIYDRKTGRFSRLSNKNKPDGARPPLPLNDYITSLAVLPGGDICVGSMGTGIAIYHPGNRVVRHYTKENSGLADNVVSSVLVAQDHSIWVGTSEGLCLFDGSTGKFKNYGESEGLANSYIKMILEDGMGVLWVSTDRGLSAFDSNKKTFRNLNEENGVQQGAFVISSGLKLSNGDLFFGGQDGFNYFNPAKLPFPPDPGIVSINQLTVNNDIIAPGAKGPITEQVSTAKKIVLKYGQNFALSYVAVNFTAPKQNMYAYKLVGYDKGWNFVRKSRTASYTNMDPGTYIFQVKSSNNGRQWYTPVTQIKIIILPPWWRTTVAYLAYFFVILGALYLIRRRGIKKIREEFAIVQEKQRIQLLVDEERKQAERLHELDLLKIRFLTDLSHEFRTPISLVMAPVEKLLEKNRNGGDAEDLKMIHRNVRRLLNMVNQLLDFRKMEEHGLRLCPLKGDIIGFLIDAAGSFKDIAAKKDIQLLIHSTHEKWVASFDHDKLERIIFNVLSNAFKFTGTGGAVHFGISVTQNDNGNCLELGIKDSGVGISPDDIDRIFDRFYQSGRIGPVLNQGTGIGLSITKEFVQLMEGTVSVESEINKGTRFLITVPLTTAETEGADEVETEITREKTAVESDCPEQPGKAPGQLATILLVEDNEEFRQYLADHLGRYYRVIEAANGKEGWQKTLSGHPQLVVSDISMPIMNGIELSQKIKSDKRTNHIPVIILTAMTGEEEQLKGLQSGASDYLTKPFNFQILHTKIINQLTLNRTLKDTYSKQIQLTGPKVEVESTDVKLLNSIMNYIEVSLNEPELSVEDLSRHVGMSRGSLYYKVRELTGLTPIEYLRKVKLEKAAVLLESSGYNVAQIAYMTGFGTPSYFSRMFKSKFGILPSDYLNNKRNERLKAAEREVNV